jgi:hypothetical protein
MPRRPRGGEDVQLYSVFNLCTRWGWVINATPQSLYSRERPGTHCTGGCVGRRAGLDECGKYFPRRDSIRSIVQLVASRYTD